MWKDSETNVDLLGFQYIHNTLNEIISNDDLIPSCIGLYGYWGSGKSSLINMSFSSLSSEDGNLCIKFNAWKFEGYDDAKSALIGSILDSIKSSIIESKSIDEKLKEGLINKTRELLRKVDKMKLAKFIGGGVLTSINPILLPLFSTFSSVYDSVKKDDSTQEVEKSFNVRKDIEIFQSEFSELINKSEIKRVIVYIDELDRCNEQTVLDTLEAVRLFLFTNYTSFVIGADERHIQNAVKRKFGEIGRNGLDLGKEYLEKMVQYPIRIPNLDFIGVEIYTLLLFAKRDLDEIKFDRLLHYIKEKRNENLVSFKPSLKEMQEIIEDNKYVDNILRLSSSISSVLTLSLEGNPRQIKRFLNTLEIRKIMAKTQRDFSFNESIMLKLMILEYVKPTIYDGFLNLSHEDKLTQILTEIKNDSEISNEYIKNSLDDNWFSNWIKSEPEIYDVDLKPYLYFSNRYKSVINFDYESIPPLVKNVIESYSKGGSSNYSRGLSMLETLSQNEMNILIGVVQTREKHNESVDIGTFILLSDIFVSQPAFIPDTLEIFAKIKSGSLTMAQKAKAKIIIDQIDGKVKEIYMNLNSNWEEEEK